MDFAADFLRPAIEGLDSATRKRVALALDCAIAFGAIEAQQGNVSLRLTDQLREAYAEKVSRLQNGSY